MNGGAILAFQVNNVDKPIAQTDVVLPYQMVRPQVAHIKRHEFGERTDMMVNVAHELRICPCVPHRTKMEYHVLVKLEQAKDATTEMALEFWNVKNEP